MRHILKIKNSDKSKSAFLRFMPKAAMVIALAFLGTFIYLSPLWATTGAVCMLVCLFVFRFLYFPKNKKGNDVLQDFINTKISAEIPQGLPLSVIYLDNSMQIVRCNEVFMQLLSSNQVSIIEIEKIFSKLNLNDNTPILDLGDESYLCHVSKPLEAGEQYYCVMLTGAGDVQRLKKELVEQKPVVALLYLDNFEEVVDSLDESRIPALTAIIDKKLNDMTIAAGGVMKKFEKDRYVFLFNTVKLLELQNKKFEILQDIRNISIGEHMPVTISMGVGMGGNTLMDTMQNARAAIDLALGRGGDQVLVKEGENFRFFGGKSGGVIHNSRIRARVKADALWELISEASDVFIMGHRNADLDSLGASIGVYAIAKAVGKRSFIVMDEVSGGIRELYEIITNDAAYSKAFITGAEAIKIVSSQTLVVVTDTHRKAMTECPGLINEARKVVLFDHHRKSVDAIDKTVMLYHEPSASSTSELVTEMIQYYGHKIRLKSVEADALLAGITVDTKNFCIKTGVITFEAAAYLKRSGADSIRVRKFFQYNMEDYQAKAAAIKDAKLYLDSMAISYCPVENENAVPITAQAADELLNISGIKASFVYCKILDIIYISARSLDEINVQRIMEKLDGGGHLTVAGAQLKGASFEDAEIKIKEAITQYLEEEYT